MIKTQTHCSSSPPTLHGSFVPIKLSSGATRTHLAQKKKDLPLNHKNVAHIPSGMLIFKMQKNNNKEICIELDMWLLAWVCVCERDPVCVTCPVGVECDNCTACDKDANAIDALRCCDGWKKCISIFTLNRSMGMRLRWETVALLKASY